MATIFEVQATGEPNGKPIYYGARRTREDANGLLEESQARVRRAGGRVRDWRIVEIDTTGAFEVPSLPAPRERFSCRAESSADPTGSITSSVEVLDGDLVVASYDRNHAMYGTFEPFRQGHHNYALIAPDYTATSVMELATGRVVASELPDDMGFCPVGFYVPDWWDVHDDSILPGSHLWRDDLEWPHSGDFGFVWGCIWGDDRSWKVQWLDLSRVNEGAITRNDRFGYVELASENGVHPKKFIHLSAWAGKRQVEFRTHQTFDLMTGEQISRDPFTIETAHD